MPPTVIEINALSDLKREVFGPVLHVLRYSRDELPQLIQDLNATGYGLTLGVHTRIDETRDFVTDHARVGNVYINRNIVGAVVGVQPFGGEGKSGTGPKAGGPLYVRRLQGAIDVSPAALSASKEKQTNPVLATFLDWASTHGHDGLAQKGDAYAHSSLNGVNIELPGPTGERNTLSFSPRGRILCGATTVDGVLHQLAAVFATGNTPVMLPRALAVLPKGLPTVVRQAIQPLNEQDILSAHLDMALLDVDSARTLRPQLAARPSEVGGLVQVIETRDDALIPVWRLVAEHALCINTTAAGGNASLMAMAG